MRESGVGQQQVARIGISILLSLAIGCSDPTSPITVRSFHIPAAVNRDISQNINLDQDNLYLYYKNDAGTIVTITPPWGSGASVYAPLNVRNDHLTPNGWVVVYNSFDTTRTNDRPVMILYNKWRGILRWWWWNDHDPPQGSGYLTHALMIDGLNTSALDFEQEFAQDYTVSSSHPFAVKTNNQQFPSGLINGAWYYFDTEFAYDPQIAGKPQSSYSLVMNAFATTTSKIKLSGDINGTIAGTISGSGTNATLIGGLTIGPLSQNSYQSGTSVVNNGADANNTLSGLINSSIGGGLANALKGNLSTLFTSGLKIISSPLQNVFNSLISSDQTPQQKVNLSLAANLNVSGDITTDWSAATFAGALPGTARGDPSGYLPYYNQTLGVFNLAAPPQVRWQVANGLYPPKSPGQTDVQYFPVVPTIILNPAIADSVTITGLTASVIYIQQYSGKHTFYNPNYLASSPFISNFPVINNMYGNVWYGFSAPYAIRYSYWTGTPETNIVEQIAFTVNPKNGSPPVDIVKIYMPTFVHN